MCIRDLANNATGIVHIPWSRIFQVGTPAKLHRLKVQTSIVEKMITIEFLQVCSAFVLSLSFAVPGFLKVSTSPTPGSGCLKLSSIEMYLSALASTRVITMAPLLQQFMLNLRHTQGPRATKRKGHTSRGVSGGWLRWRGPVSPLYHIHPPRM